MLELHDLRKGFGSGVRRVEAVRGVSLRLERGEVFGLLGPNGAGKTTTIGMAIGLIRPDGGEAVLEGVGPTTEPAARRRIGVAPQELALYGTLTARENLEVFGALYGMGRGERRSRAGELLERTGLGDRAGDRVEGFSGGMKRRLNLAAALMHDPDVVLLDEPTAGVDPHSRHAIFGLVEELRERSRTVLYTTHYMEEAERLCDRVGIIDRGELLAMGPLDGLIEEHGGSSVVTVVTGEGEERRVETTEPGVAIPALLVEVGVPRSLRLDRPDLERVFLKLTGRTLRD